MIKYYPIIENQKEKLKCLCEEKLNSLYKNVSSEIKERLNYELEMIHKTETEAIFLLLSETFRKLNLKTNQFAIRGLMGNSLVAFLCGISNVDPVKFGLLPYLALGVDGCYKEPDIDINFSSEELLKKIIEELESCDEIYKLVNANVKSVSGKLTPHVSKQFIIPKIKEFGDNNYYEIVNKLQTTDCHEIDEFYSLDFFTTDALSILNELSEKTNKNLEDIDIDNDSVIDYLINEEYDVVFEKVPEISNSFYVDIANFIKPVSFDDLVKIVSLGHGTNVWDNNAEVLMEDIGLSIDDVIINRDDLFSDLQKYGFSIEDSFKITEDVRKGKTIPKDKYDSNVLKEHNVPEWFEKSCNKIKYLFPKGHAISNTLIYWRLIWFKINFDTEYNSVAKKYL